MSNGLPSALLAHPDGRSLAGRGRPKAQMGDVGNGGRHKETAHSYVRSAPSSQQDVTVKTRLLLFRSGAH